MQNGAGDLATLLKQLEYKQVLYGADKSLQGTPKYSYQQALSLMRQPSEAQRYAGSTILAAPKLEAMSTSVDYFGNMRTFSFAEYEGLLLERWGADF